MIEFKHGTRRDFDPFTTSRFEIAHQIKSVQRRAFCYGIVAATALNILIGIASRFFK